MALGNRLVNSQARLRQDHGDTRITDGPRLQDDLNPSPALQACENRG